MAINDLLDMQKELMEEVPHGLRPDVYAQVLAVKEIMVKSLLYLTSLGHKPWRPNPLPLHIQRTRLDNLSNAITLLRHTRDQSMETLLTDDEYEKRSRKLISAFGVIEEILEFLDCADDDRPHKLEEITDVLFFYLESMILEGFTWEEIEVEYKRKHAINLERYRKAKEGDYLWDKRAESEKL